mmetsp:Transcript_29300/g.41787  ORF Transcript_29300/g.41787 Transcript_29300/m.41787 type:complete len:87 (+) Transcript_29300:100-360(+)
MRACAESSGSGLDQTKWHSRWCLEYDRHVSHHPSDESCAIAMQYSFMNRPGQHVEDGVMVLSKLPILHSDVLLLPRELSVMPLILY